MDRERGIDVVVDPVFTSLGGPGGGPEGDTDGPVIARGDGLRLRFQLSHRGNGADVELPEDADLRVFIVTPEGAVLLDVSPERIPAVAADSGATPPVEGSPRSYRVAIPRNAVPTGYAGFDAVLGIKLILPADPQPGADEHWTLAAIPVRVVASIAGRAP